MTKRPAAPRGLLLPSWIHPEHALYHWIEDTCIRARLDTDMLLRRYRHLRHFRDYLQDDFDKLTPEEIAAALDVAEDEFRIKFAAEE